MRMLQTSNPPHENTHTSSRTPQCAGSTRHGAGETVGILPHGLPHRSGSTTTWVHESTAPVAQVDRAVGFYPTGSAFESRRGLWNRDPISVADRILLVVVLVLLGMMAAGTPRADAAGWQRGTASSYGPGLFGNRTACGQTLTPATRGVAHRSLACGTRLVICRRGRCTHARVIDRGPAAWTGRALDLTAATTRDLCGCSPYQWGVRTLRWRRA